MFVVEYLHTSSGGHPAYARELARGIHDAGGRVRVLGGTGSPEDDFLDGEVTTPNTRLSPGSPSWLVNRVVAYLTQPLQIVRYLRRYGTEQVRWFHSQQLPSIGASLLLAMVRLLGWNVAVTVHNVQPHVRRLQDRLIQRLHRRAWRNADLLIVHSTSLVSGLREALGERAPRVVVVPHPVWSDHERIVAEPSKQFLFFGHLRPNKGVEDFLEALADLGDPPATIAGAGDPARVAELRREIQKLGLANLVLRAEFVPDVELPELFADHAVVVTPYRSFEAQSGVTHLAVAHGRPIVVTDVGALRDLVDEFGLGEVVERGDSLPQVMENAVRLAGEGVYEAGLATAKEQLSPASVGARLLKEFSIAGDHR